MMRPPALALVAVTTLSAACGGSSSSPGGPVTTSAAAPTSATTRAFNMRLLAHLDLATLTSTAHVHHDEPFEVEGAFSGSGNWGYTSPDGRRFLILKLQSNQETTSDRVQFLVVQNWTEELKRLAPVN